MAREGHVVLIHAFPLSARQWESQRDAMPERWRLLTPDLPGFGASDRTAVSRMDDMAWSVLASLDAARIERAVIGGMSMGGYVTLALHRLAPERFSGMILVDTRATADNEAQREGRQKMIETVRAKGSPAIADEMVPKLLGATTQRERPELAAQVRTLIETNPPGAIAGALEAMRDRPDSTAQLGTIAVPTLIVCGEEDLLTPPSDSEALHRGIAGSRLVLVPQAGHLSSLEAPAAFSAALSSFLGSPELGTTH